MAMTTLPVLDRTSATFRSDVDTFFGSQLPGFASEANALQADITAKQVDVTAKQADVTAKQIAVAESAATAKAQADAAAAAAVSAVNAPGTSATSATTLTVSTGTKEFLIQPGKAFFVGQFVTVSSSSGEYMLGRIAEHDPATGAMSVDVTYAPGSATASAWVVALAAVAPSGIPVGTLVTDAAVAMRGGGHYVLTSASAVAATLPAAPVADDWLWITVDNGRTDNTLKLNGSTLTGPAGMLSGVVTLNVRNHMTIGLRYINDIIQWRLV